jgi:hypothetical protein
MNVRKKDIAAIIDPDGNLCGQYFWQALFVPHIQN